MLANIRLEILVEEPSAAEALRVLVPRILGSELAPQIRQFQGKPALLRKLPQRLRGYARLPAEHRPRILVLVDRDTSEALERLLQRAGYHRGGLKKVEAARSIAEHMAPDANRSPSFRVFRDGLIRLVHGAGLLEASTDGPSAQGRRGP